MEISKTRVIAKGFHNGNKVSIECIKTDKGIVILVEGDNNEYIEVLLKKKIIQNDLDNENTSHSYHPNIDSIEAYWLALHNLEDYFDSKPDIEIIGDLDTEGSPYDNFDDFEIVY